MENVHKAISDGLANAKADPVEWGTPVAPSLAKHPNVNLLLPTMNTFTVTRKVMDKTQGDRGMMRLNVKAVNAAEAGRLADEQVARINAPFAESDRRKDDRRR